MSIFANMLVQTASIHGLKRSDYDDLLSRGWFRGNGIVYRSEVVCIDGGVFGIRNIRFPVNSFSMRRSHRKLFSANNNLFTVRIGTPRCDAQRENLYQELTPRFKAFVHESLEGLLLSPRTCVEFDTLEIAVYDGSELVAASYIDVGDSSMASILCIYSQDYKKYSLGMFTMLLELDLAKRLGLDYYYPGYVLDSPSAFDYKLLLGPCEWLTDQQCWSVNKSDADPGKGELIRRKLSEAEELLRAAGHCPKRVVYPYYTLGHLLLERPDLLRVPSYLVIESSVGPLAISYDLQMDSYICFDLHQAKELDFVHSLKLSNDYLLGSSYELNPLCCTFFHRLREDLFSEDLNHIISILKHAESIA
jgi:arginyl-tRNA--protein-N-Asp/Glu arginylyltransferase